MPAKTSSIQTRVRYGRYVCRRLSRAGYDDLADPVREANRALLASQRQMEDLEFPEEDALADRDEADDALDTESQQARLRLASRNVGANREEPYTQIFPDGLDYYTEARMESQELRYGELIERIESFLPPADPVRTEVPPRLEKLLVEWKEAKAAVDTARTQIAVASTRRQATIGEWTELMEKTHGTLISRIGKKKAERFFPKSGRSRSEAATAEAVPPEEPAGPQKLESD